MNPIQITTERLDDIPLLYSLLDQMNIRALIDQSFPAHGNWTGLSPGMVIQLWLTYLVSQADHRLKYVETWAETRCELLSTLCGQTVTPRELNDDRLASLLEALSRDAAWQEFQTAFTQGLVLTYTLPTDTIRHDSTTVSTYSVPDPDGLVRLGHSKDHRHDLGQIKVMLSTLDPLALPVGVSVLDGSRADDPLYIPALEGVRATLGTGLLHVGDSKMAARDIRAHIASHGDYYLCPLPALQREDWATYLDPVRHGEVALLPLTRTLPNGTVETYASGYTRETTCTVDSYTWTERQFVVKSVAYAASQERAFRTRLAQTCAQLDDLLVTKRGKTRPTTFASLEATVADIVTTTGMDTILQVSCHEAVTTRTIRAYRDRPTRTVPVSTLSLTYEIDEARLTQVIDDFGWRVYATQAPPDRLSLSLAVHEYRSEYRIEHSFSRLKGQSLSLHPMYLQRDEHRIGLVRLLSLALSLLSLLQYVVRRELTQTNQELTGLYGQMTTDRPTSERILQTFDNITLTIIKTEHETIRHTTPLTSIQRTILTLLKITPDVYQFQQPT